MLNAPITTGLAGLLDIWQKNDMINALTKIIAIKVMEEGS
jgi:hypothetical protein